MFVERTVFFGAYSMRRLDDAKKLSSAWKGTAINSSLCTPTGAEPDFLNWHHADRHYDIVTKKNFLMGAREFCDLVIHSFIFLEFLRDDKSIEGILITSDKKKSKGLWLFSVDAIAGLMVQTANDDPASVHIQKPGGEWEVWRGKAHPTQQDRD